MTSQDPVAHTDLLGAPDHLESSDREFAKRLEQLARRRAVTRADRDRAIADLLVHTDTEAALSYLGLDLDELRREP